MINLEKGAKVVLTDSGGIPLVLNFFQDCYFLSFCNLFLVRHSFLVILNSFSCESKHLFLVTLNLFQGLRS